MKTTYNTKDYVNAHGKAPRGDGAWAFSVMASDGAGAYTDLGTMWASGPYADAKRAVTQRARQEAASIGVRELIIEVLS